MSNPLRITLAVFILILLGGSYAYWNSRAPVRETRERAQNRVSYSDRMGVEKPHPEVTRLFGEVQQALLDAFAPGPADGAWVSAGEPPLGISAIKALQGYAPGQRTVWALESEGWYCLRGTRTSDLGKPLIWTAVVREDLVPAEMGITRLQYRIEFLQLGRRTQGNLPKRLQWILEK